MSIWVLIQVVINIFLFVGLFVCIVRSPRRNADDPRLSRGLQLLQSKISILEDLSDKTDLQFQKMTSLIEQKVQGVQQAVAAAERHLRSLEEATQKGIETTRLVQTGMGAEQVIERHTNEVYARAAQLAFEGRSIEEICETLELSRGEVELIVKFNRDSLRTVTSSQVTPAVQKQPSSSLSSLFEVPQFDASSLNKLGEEFRRVTREAEEQQKTREEAEQSRYLGFRAKLEKAEFVSEPPVLIPPSFTESQELYPQEVPQGEEATMEETQFEESMTEMTSLQGGKSVATQAPIVSETKSAEVPQQELAQAATPTRKPAPTITVGGKARELNSAPVVRKVVFPRINSPG